MSDTKQPAFAMARTLQEAVLQVLRHGEAHIAAADLAAELFTEEEHKAFGAAVAEAVATGRPVSVGGHTITPGGTP